VHPDQVEELERAAPLVVPLPTAAGAYDPLAFPTWAEARKAYPFHGLIRIVDADARTSYVTPLHPFDDLADYRLDGQTFVVSAAAEISAEDADAAARSQDPGPFVPRR
jgi:hypothetical protein